MFVYTMLDLKKETYPLIPQWHLLLSASTAWSKVGAVLAVGSNEIDRQQNLCCNFVALSSVSTAQNRTRNSPQQNSNTCRVKCPHTRMKPLWNPRDSKSKEKNSVTWREAWFLECCVWRAMWWAEQHRRNKRSDNQIAVDPRLIIFWPIPYQKTANDKTSFELQICLYNLLPWASVTLARCITLRTQTILYFVEET
jgi:hypothetical protein